MSDSYSGGRIVVMPGRVGGLPTLGDSRLPAETVARIHVAYGFDRVVQCWDYLTETDVKLACWWIATKHPRTKDGQFLKEWVSDNELNLSAGRWQHAAMPPTRGAEDDG